MYRVEVTANPDASFKAKSGEYELTIDLKGKGISPPDTFLASLAGCLGVYIRKYCGGSGLTLNNFSITAEAELCQDKPMCFKDIRVCVDLKGAELDEHRKKALLEFIKNCPIHNTLIIKPSVDIKII